jgi:hypothetical protein
MLSQALAGPPVWFLISNQSVCQIGSPSRPVPRNRATESCAVKLVSCYFPAGIAVGTGSNLETLAANMPDWMLLDALQILRGVRYYDTT